MLYYAVLFYCDFALVSLTVNIQVYREKTGESEPLKDNLTLSELGFKVGKLEQKKCVLYWPSSDT